MSTTLVYSTNTDSDDLSVCDAAERRELTRISVGGSPRGAVKFDAAKEFGYVSNCAGNTISVIDLARNIEVTRIAVGLAPRGLAIAGDGKIAYVSNSGSNSLSVVDLTARRQVAEIPMGSNPRHMALIPGRNMLLISQWGADSVALLDLSKLGDFNFAARTASTGANSRPYSVAVTPSAQIAYVANTQADYVSVIDPVTGAEIKRIKVGFGSRAIAFSKDEKYAFVSVEPPNEIAVVETESSQVVHRVAVGASPRGIAVDYDSDILYGGEFGRSLATVGTRNSVGLVDVSDPPNARYVGEIKVGLGPCSVAILKR